MTHVKKPSPDTGKVSTIRLTEGASVSRHVRMNTKYERKRKSMIFLRNGNPFLLKKTKTYKI